MLKVIVRSIYTRFIFICIFIKCLSQDKDLLIVSQQTAISKAPIPFHRSWLVPSVPSTTYRGGDFGPQKHLSAAAEPSPQPEKPSRH